MAGKTTTAHEARKTKVFISYSRKDITFADRVQVELETGGFETLIDREEIYAFEDWWTRIQVLIAKSDTIVFILSPDAVASQVCAKEIGFAASLNKRFAPIVCRRVDDSAIPDTLRRLNFIFFDDETLFDGGIKLLIEALQTDIEWVRKHTEFGEAARRWSQAGRPGPQGLLLHSPALEEAEHWIGSRPESAPLPTEEARAFIAASRNAAIAARRRSRIQKTTLYTMLATIITALVGWINQSYLAEQWHWWTVGAGYREQWFRPDILSPPKEQALRPGATFRECRFPGFCPEMVVVPAGSFMMGGPRDNQQPQHEVTFARPFAVSKYELTFPEWTSCLTGGGCNDYYPVDQGWGQGLDRPLVNVSWSDAKAYVAWLSSMTGKTYRLLTEAEYEYAARAGATTAYPWGDDIELKSTPMANCNGCGSPWDGKQAAPIGSFAPNEFGLYDMIGNVFEWTEDCFHVGYKGAPTDGSAWVTGGDCRTRSIRGGSWISTPDILRSAYHEWPDVNGRFYHIGFRVARTLVAP